MKLRALTLTNVRKFGGRTASLTGIGDGLTVVSEANEFGKSTFFDALHALFFQSHSSTAKPVKSLQPHAGGGVEVSAEVETPEGRFVIEKRFLAKKGASVRDLDRGTVIARDGEAESWIARLIGEAEQGPAGLLWVRQGVVGLEPADGSKSEREKLTEARRDLMSSVAGEIDQVTGGRRMDRILARCADDFDRIATPTGQAKGAWKEAKTRLAALQEEHAALTLQCDELAEALAERVRVQAELSRLDDRDAVASMEIDLRSARDRLAKATAHAAKVTEAEQNRRIAELERDRAAAALLQLKEDLSAFEEAGKARVAAERDHAAAQSTLAEARAAETEAKAASQSAEALLAGLRKELAAVERAVAARKARDEIQALEKRLETARKHEEEARAAAARVAANPATPEALAQAEEAATEVARLVAALQARSATLSVTYEGTERITLNGVEVPDAHRLKLGEIAEIGLPGIGQLRLDLPPSEALEGLEEELASARKAETAALAACGAESLSDARANARSRSEAQEAQKLAEQLLAVTVPEGIAALETTLQAVRDRASAEEADAEMRAPDVVVAEVDAAETALTSARERLAQRADVVGDVRDTATRCEMARDAARQAHERAESVLGPVEERAGRREAAETATRNASEAVASAVSALEAMRKDAPDLATEAANLKRAEDAIAAAAKRRVALQTRSAELSTLISTRAGENVEARRDEAAGEIAALETRVARFEAEKAALSRLRAALEAARESAREAYFGPVQEELKPLLGILHDEAAIDWQSDTIMPGALRRGGEVEEFDTLSGGTQEQIAILTRLAFARLFARRGQHLPIILDDALVYSDDDRIVKMFTALNRVATDQQILVFSCRQMAFKSLGGERPEIALEEAA